MLIFLAGTRIRDDNCYDLPYKPPQKRECVKPCENVYGPEIAPDFQEPYYGDITTETERWWRPRDGYDSRNQGEVNIIDCFPLKLS